MIFASMLILGALIGFVGAGGAGVTITLLVVGFGVPIHTALAVALASMVFTMLCSILLGMGVPTTANYIIQATISAPALVALGVAVPLSEYMEEGAVTMSSMLLGAVLTTMFLICSLLVLNEFRRITVWQGRIDVQPVLWPFARRHYRLADFDGVYYVTNETDSDYKISLRERWYMKNGRRKLCIAENVYANFEELASATRTNYLGEMNVGPIEQIRAALGKTYYTLQNNSTV